MRTQAEHYHQLTETWADVHERVKAGTANAVEVRELVVDLMAYAGRHWNENECKWIVEQALSDLVRWLNQHIDQAPPEQSGLKAHRVEWFDRVRYWLVRDLVAAGVASRKAGACPMVACQFAAAYLKHFDLPAGRGNGGTGAHVTPRAIKRSFEKVAKQADQGARWNLPDDEGRVEVTDESIAAVKSANPRIKIE